MHHATVLADVTVVEVVMRLAIHDPQDRSASGCQVFGVHVVGNCGTDQLACPVAQQRFAGIADKDDLVVPVDHEDRVEHQVDQPGVQRVQVYGHGSRRPRRDARS